MRPYLRFGALAFALALGVDLAAAQTRAPDGLQPPVGAVNPANPAQLQLTPAQKTAILNAVREKSASVRPSTTSMTSSGAPTLSPTSDARSSRTSSTCSPAAIRRTSSPS